jgi:predicted solute-binding protein
MTSRIAKLINIDSKEEINVRSVSARIRKQNKFDTGLIIHYTYEKRLTNIKNDIHQLWNQIFQQTPVINTRLIIDNRNSRNLKKELVHQQAALEKHRTNID